MVFLKGFGLRRRLTIGAIALLSAIVSCSLDKEKNVDPVGLVEDTQKPTSVELSKRVKNSSFYFLQGDHSNRLTVIPPEQASGINTYAQFVDYDRRGEQDAAILVEDDNLMVLVNGPSHYQSMLERGILSNPGNDNRFIPSEDQFAFFERFDRELPTQNWSYTQLDSSLVRKVHLLFNSMRLDSLGFGQMNIETLNGYPLLLTPSSIDEEHVMDSGNNKKPPIGRPLISYSPEGIKYADVTFPNEDSVIEFRYETRPSGNEWYLLYRAKKLTDVGDPFAMVADSVDVERSISNTMLFRMPEQEHEILTSGFSAIHRVIDPSTEGILYFGFNLSLRSTSKSEDVTDFINVIPQIEQLVHARVSQPLSSIQGQDLPSVLGSYDLDPIIFGDFERLGSLMNYNSASKRLSVGSFSKDLD